jgi:hypothetical protein
MGGPSESGWQLHLPNVSSQKNVVLVVYEWASNNFYRKPVPVRIAPHNL